MARENYLKFGAVREDVLQYVRKPKDDEFEGVSSLHK